MTSSVLEQMHCLKIKQFISAFVAAAHVDSTSRSRGTIRGVRAGDGNPPIWQRKIKTKEIMVSSRMPDRHVTRILLPAPVHGQVTPVYRHGTTSSASQVDSHHDDDLPV